MRAPATPATVADAVRHRQRAVRGTALNEAASATETSARLERLLEELSAAVDADAGAGLYLDDGDGRLELVAQSSGPSRRTFRLPRIVPAAQARTGLPAWSSSRYRT